MKEKFSIGKVNGTDIFAVKNDQGDVLVPVKHICTALGVDYGAQWNKIQSDESFSSTIAIIATVGADEKSREMMCLPLRRIYGWLYTINPGKVAPEAKEAVKRYRDECCDVLYDHFFAKTQRTQEVIDIERNLMKERKDLDETLSGLMKSVSDIKSRVKSIDGQLDKLQAERLNPQPSLF